MLRFLILLFCVFFVGTQAFAAGFSYPLKDGAVIECQGKKVHGSVSEFEKYTDTFVVKDGALYSTTMNKMFKPNKAKVLKKVDQVHYKNGMIKMYDPLWEPKVRHHMRFVKINPKTGEYGTIVVKDNWVWFQKAGTKGYCRRVK